MNPSLELVGLEVHYPRRTALRGLTARVHVGVTSVIGPNGAGKSTLFRAVAGLQNPTDGHVRLGTAVSTRSDWQRLVGFLPQEPEFAGGVTVADTVALAGWMKGLPRATLSDAVGRCIELVGLGDRAGERVRTLSGGMRRRLGFATAAVHEPRLLVLDEPTAGLDPLQRRDLLAAIRVLAMDRIVMMSTHVLDDVRGVGGEVAVLSRGAWVVHGSLPEIVRAAELGIGRVLDPDRGDDLETAYGYFQTRPAG